MSTESTDPFASQNIPDLRTKSILDALGIWYANKTKQAGATYLAFKIIVAREEQATGNRKSDRGYTAQDGFAL